MKHTLHLFLFFSLMGIQTVTAQQHDRYGLGKQADLDTIPTAVLMRFDGDSIVQRRSEYPSLITDSTASCWRGRQQGR
jgi:hypothetical protein